MNAHHESSISFFLVRYGQLERVGWFGSIHSVEIPRRTPVVVETLEGCWLGVLLQSGNSQTHPHVHPGGELLRLASSEDLAAAQHAATIAENLRQDASKRLEMGSISPIRAEKEKELVWIVAADVSIDCQVGLLQFAGSAGAPLAQLGLRLAQAHALQRVQWLEESPPLLEENHVRSRSAASISKTAPPQRLPCTTTPSILETIALVHGVSEEHPGSAAKRLRLPLGMLGSYLQKIRPLDSPGPPQRQWMVRVRLTGGSLLTSQFLALDQLARSLAGGSLRLTMRQGIEIHGVIPKNLSPLLTALAKIAVTTSGTCGDAVRNVTCCPYRFETAAHRLARTLATQISTRWLPRAPWLEGVLTPADDADPGAASPTPAHEALTDHAGSLAEDPAYPHGALPHKWKIGVATQDDNCIDVLTNDLGLVVRPAPDARFRVDCYLGGSLAYRHEDPQSQPELAVPLWSVSPAGVEPLIETLMEIHQQFATDAKRHYRRLKYLVRQIGLEELRALVMARYRGDRDDLLPCEPSGIPPRTSHPKWLREDRGTWALRVPIPTGRLRGTGKTDDLQRTVPPWRRLIELGKSLSVAPHHALVVGGIAPESRAEAEKLLEEIETEPRLRLLTCVARPYCPLALAESETAYDRWHQAGMESLEIAAKLLHKSCTDTPLIMALSGCENCCSHPLVVDVGVVAETPSRYRVFLGGDGQQLGREVALIDGPDQLAPALHRLLGPGHKRDGAKDLEKFPWP